jgi:hypothetical protein
MQRFKEILHRCINLNEGHLEHGIAQIKYKNNESITLVS